MKTRAKSKQQGGGRRRTVRQFRISTSKYFVLIQKRASSCSNPSTMRNKTHLTPNAKFNMQKWKLLWKWVTNMPGGVLFYQINTIRLFHSADPPEHICQTKTCAWLSHICIFWSVTQQKCSVLWLISFRKVHLTLPLCSNGAAAFSFHCRGWICAARQHEQLSPLASGFQGILLVQLSQSEEQPEGTATLTCLLR